MQPLDEQRRLVNILEDHLSRLDAAEVGLRSVLARVNSMEEDVILRSLVRAASPVPDGLVHALAAGSVPDLPDGWNWRLLGDLAEVVGGVTKDAKKQSDPSYVEVPYLRVANVQRARLDLSHVSMIRVSPAKAAQLRLMPGDVLMNEGGDRDKLARGWVWRGEIAECIHQNHVYRARPNADVVLPEWLAWCANTYGTRWAQKHGKQSVNLASISLSTIRQMPCPVPPLDYQESSLAWVSELRSANEHVRRAIGAAIARSASLRRALLAAAFSGRLTGHPSDVDRVEELV